MGMFATLLLFALRAPERSEATAFPQPMLPPLPLDTDTGTKSAITPAISRTAPTNTINRFVVTANPFAVEVNDVQIPTTVRPKPTGGRGVTRRVGGYTQRNMAKYVLNEAAVTKARKLIDGRQYVLDSDWGEVQPKAPDQNSFLENHGWDDYAQWHLGLTEGATDETKARYAFVYGDFRRVHRTALIACVYRASEWRHKDVELAAHDLLQYLDNATG
jgi:hypothetical protein